MSATMVMMSPADTWGSQHDAYELGGGARHGEQSGSLMRIDGGHVCREERAEAPKACRRITYMGHGALPGSALPWRLTQGFSPAFSQAALIIGSYSDSRRASRAG